MIATCLMLTGCVPDSGPQQQQRLAAGYDALEQKQYDRAIALAEDYLRLQPSGDGSAEAMYLRGRAIYARAVAQPRPAGDLGEARANYLRALTLGPGTELEALIRADLANVAYYQEDYASAERDWSAAYPRIADRNAQAWMLYRIGLCRQRMGRFADADACFASVQQHYAGTEQASRARDKQGKTAFHVQVATFQSTVSADQVVAKLRTLGLNATRALKPGTSLSLVMVGPYGSYAIARNARRQIATQYPDAIVVP